MDVANMGACTPAASAVAVAGARRDRRFALLFLPIMALSGLAWFAVIRWGGTRDMRRGLLTGGPALMTMDGAMPGMDMPGMDMSGMDMHASHLASSGGGGHSMSMLGVSMLGKDPISPAYAGLFLWMWAAMVLAMMVPAMLPSLRGFFRTETALGCGAGARFFGGVLAVWVLVGAAMYVALA